MGDYIDEQSDYADDDHRYGDSTVATAAIVDGTANQDFQRQYLLATIANQICVCWQILFVNIDIVDTRR